MECIFYKYAIQISLSLLNIINFHRFKQISKSYGIDNILIILNSTIIVLWKRLYNCYSTLLMVHWAIAQWSIIISHHTKCPSLDTIIILESNVICLYSGNPAISQLQEVNCLHTYVVLSHCRLYKDHIKCRFTIGNKAMCVLDFW